MKTKPILFAAGVLGTCALMPMEGRAQEYALLHSFSPKAFVNSDGWRPTSLIAAAGIVFGTTSHGGANGNGVIFRINADGTGFTALHTFPAMALAFVDATGAGHYTNNDGADPSSLTFSGSILYGRTTLGGPNGTGTIFKINTDGTGFTTIFNSGLGASSSGSDLAVTGATLYGTEVSGGAGGNGAVFKINTDGTGFAVLHDFSSGQQYTNSEGREPVSLLVSDDTLYGAASLGGMAGNGTLFKMSTDGTGFTILHQFTPGYQWIISSNGGGYTSLYTNNDGASPAYLVLSNRSLFGSAQTGGNFGRGTAFRLNTDGTGFASLHSFHDLDGPSFSSPNSDGVVPGSLALLGSTLYGLTSYGGSAGGGTLYSVNLDGTGFNTRYHFIYNPSSSEGWAPIGLASSGGSLFGGLSYIEGSVFKFTEAGGLRILHRFSTASELNNDGDQPTCLIESNGTLYGQTGEAGTIFKVQEDGHSFTILHVFTNLDGNWNGALVASGNVLYGIASAAGDFSFGSVFRLSTDGSGFVNLHSFSLTNDGATPTSLISSGDVLFGTATDLGGHAGTVFSLKTDGTAFTTVHPFSGDGTEGARPNSLALSGRTLFGTTYWGGAWSNGTVFRVEVDGTGFAVLHHFSPQDPGRANGDGANPVSLLIADNALYGATAFGGPDGLGTIFKINPDGSGFTSVHALNYSGDCWVDEECFCPGNCEGINPTSLFVAGSTLYGTTQDGGSAGRGTVFKLNLDGTGFSVLHTFSYYYGAGPVALLFSGNTLYGVAGYGGAGQSGAVFRLAVAPRLSIVGLSGNVLLSWPTNFTGFGLQFTSNATPAAIWEPLLQPVGTANGQFMVTNPIARPQGFFRLAQ